MGKYLYGAAVQGIQHFIFQSNKLREIVGASEMVSQICTRLFYELLQQKEYASDAQLSEAMCVDGNFILHAAGNIKYIFEDKDICERMVLEFPKRVMEYAPGITLSQAVVEFNDDFSSAVSELERKLAIQRNKPFRSMTLGLMGIARSRRTGLPVTTVKQDYYDEATLKKLQASELQGLMSRATGCNIKETQIAYNVSDLADDGNNWIAVIHADGNGLGSIVQKVGCDSSRLKIFSEELDKITVSAAQAAYDMVASAATKTGFLPIRPVVLSGDDFTVICRADIALEYTHAFLKAFEEKTKVLIKPNEIFIKGSKRDCMTACAGIAYVKASYPFYYAYELAENLCSAAKADAKDNDDIRKGIELPQSCILFHKVQDSVNEEYDEIIERELHPRQDLWLNFGPYYLTEKPERWTVDQLLEEVKKLHGEKGNVVKNSIREWLSAVYQGTEKEEILTRRIRQLHQKEDVFDTYQKAVSPNGLKKVPAYDILVIKTITAE